MFALLVIIFIGGGIFLDKYIGIEAPAFYAFYGSLLGAMMAFTLAGDY